MVSAQKLVAGLFGVLLLMAIFFYLERALFLDASFILFRIINLDELQIQEHRYGSFITQGIPLLGSRVGLPLHIIVFLYSISFNVFYLVVALLLIYKFKELPLAILMAFYFLLFVSDTWFWTNNEVHQGIAWMFLFFGWVIYLGKKKTRSIFTLLIFLPLAFLSIFTHPLILFPLLFLWFFLMSRKDWPFNWKWTLVYSLILLIFCWIKYRMSSSPDSFYDAEKLKATQDLNIREIWNAITSPMVAEFIKRLVWNYWAVPAIFVWGVVVAARNKKWMPVLLTAVFSIAFSLAICLVFRLFIPFYSESEWMPGTIIFSSLFVYYALPILQKRTVLLILLFIFAARLLYILSASDKWVERKNWTMNTLDKMEKAKLTKVMVEETDQNKTILMMHWGSPTESIIASALRGDKPQRTFVVDSKDNLRNRIPSHPDQMIAPFDIISNKELNPRYFSLDTTSSYQFLQ